MVLLGFLDLLFLELLFLVPSLLLGFLVLLIGLILLNIAFLLQAKEARAEVFLTAQIDDHCVRDLGLVLLLHGG